MRSTSSQLINEYCEATKRLYGVTVRVSAKDANRFLQLEKELISNDILPRHYAGRLLKHLRSWVRYRKLKCVPVNVFLGDWALSLYLKELDEKSQRIALTDEDRMVMVQEAYRILVYAYVNRKDYDVAEIDLEPVIGNMWRQANYRERDAALRQASHQLEQMSGHLSIQSSVQT